MNNDSAAPVSAGPVVKVARDLREIEDLYESLLVQAIHHAGAKLMPGGEAMVAMGPVASLSDWEDQVAYIELVHLATCEKLDHTRCRFNDWIGDEDEQEPPLQTLLFWSEQWRTEAGYSIDRPNMRTEANFIRGRLDWAWDNEPMWDHFARDIAKAKARLENLLHAGSRAAFKGVACLYDECRGARLIRKTVPTRGSDGEKAWRLTDWHCPRCKRSWDEKRYASMVTAATEALHYESFGGETWASVDRAAQRVDRPRLTVWSWADRVQVRAVCRLSDRRVFVHLDDARARDALARQRHARRLATMRAK